jgi:hypothetical protein
MSDTGTNVEAAISELVAAFPAAFTLVPSSSLAKRSAAA